MVKTILYLTRHGQTVWNNDKKMQGHQDVPLTELGKMQAIWLGQALDQIEFSKIYTSSSLRAIKTAEYIRGTRPLSIETRDDLREMAFGVWEGKTQDELRNDYAEQLYAFWNTPHRYQPVPGGETFFDVQKRAIPAIQDIIAQHKGDTVLIISHAFTLKIILGFFNQLPIEQMCEMPPIRQTALYKVVVEDDVAKIELYGDISHYRVVSL